MSAPYQAPQPSMAALVAAGDRAGIRRDTSASMLSNVPPDYEMVLRGASCLSDVVIPRRTAGSVFGDEDFALVESSLLTADGIRKQQTLVANTDRGLLAIVQTGFSLVQAQAATETPVSVSAALVAGDSLTGGNPAAESAGQTQVEGVYEVQAFYSAPAVDSNPQQGAESEAFGALNSSSGGSLPYYDPGFGGLGQPYVEPYQDPTTQQNIDTSGQEYYGMGVPEPDPYIGGSFGI